ncbi:MAG: xanthine dehydrogenase molybdopterin binding subunit, partial [Arenicellales bacterium]
MSNAANTSPGAALAHDSALKHTTGEAVYIDDIPLPADTLHLAVGGADTAVGTITAVALDAVRAAPGVIDVFCAADIPGENDVSPSGRGDEPLLASGEIRFDGEPVFAVVAASHRAARAAAALGQVTVRPAEPVLTVDDALSQNRFISDEQVMTRGDWREAMRAAPHTTAGTLYCGG